MGAFDYFTISLLKIEITVWFIYGQLKYAARGKSGSLQRGELAELLMQCVAAIGLTGAGHSWA